ncbi:TolC family protein [soil metagenome]
MKKILILCFFLLSFISSQAQDNKTSFSLKQAIDYALTNEGTVKNALIDEEISHEKVKELIGLGTPQIEGSADINNFLEIPTSFVPAEFFNGEPGTYAPVQFGQKYSSTVGLTATQLLFDGSYVVGLQASRAYQDLSRKQTHQTKVETVAKVSKAYYGVLVMESRMTIINANIDRVKKLADDTKALYQNGFAEKIDASRIQLTYNNLLVEREKVERFKILAVALLKFQMGYDPLQPLTLTDNLKDYPYEAQNNLPDSADYKKLPQYDVIMAQNKLGELDLKRYKYTYLPSFVAFGSLSANASRSEFDIFDTSKPWYPTSVIGLKLTVPIWDGLQKNSRISQAKLNLMKIDNASTIVKNGIQLEYETAQVNYKNNLAALKTVQENRDLAAEISSVSKIKYDNGVGSSLELVDAESALREADANFFNTLYDTIVSKIDLDKASGNIAY